MAASHVSAKLFFFQPEAILFKFNSIQLKIAWLIWNLKLINPWHIHLLADSHYTPAVFDNTKNKFKEYF